MPTSGFIPGAEFAMVVVRMPNDAAVPRSGTRGIVSALKHAIRSIETGAGKDSHGLMALAVPPIDGALGGGFARAALHEIAAARESAIAAASGFALALAARAGDARAVLWIAEDMGLIENGAPYGPGLDDLDLAPERLVTVAAAKSRDVLWAMEEALRCRAVGAVVGEIRTQRLDLRASRRLSLAAGRRGVCAFLLRTAPGAEASAAATRWVVATAPSSASAACPGPPRVSVQLIRNRRGPVGSWVLEWNRVEQRFDLASSLPQSVADAACDRSHRAAAAGA
jgi:protein ImuA